MPTAKILTIILNKSIHLEEIPEHLYKHLTAQLEIPNPKWLENERMGRWNWSTPKTLCLYIRTSSGGLLIPRGYMGALMHRCKTEGIGYSIQDERRTFIPIDYTFSGSLKPFQKIAVDAMLGKHFGTLAAPTGSGKTIMAIQMIAIRKQPALIIVHTKELAIQWAKQIEHFLNIPETEIGFIGSGKKKSGKQITIALVQSLYKCAEEIAPRIGFLIVDECHRCPSRTFTEAVSKFDSKYMMGLSATPWRRDNLSKLIFWYLGDVRHSIDKNQLIQTGDILQAEVIVRETEFKPNHDPVTAYSKMLSELTSDDVRNHLIASDVAAEARTREGICLVLSDRKNHCETLKAILTYKHKIVSELITGDVDIVIRTQILKKLEEGRAKVLIATGQLIGEGFDCPDLSTIFLTTPVRFSGRVVQYIGRVLRPAPGKKQARIFDYVDVNVGVLVAGANARQKMYR